MRFSEHFKVAHPAGTDWFDPLLDQDTPLYVDPFLVLDDQNGKKLWRGSHDEVVDFFELAAQLVVAAQGNKPSPAHSKALRLLRFPEPNEFALGVSMGKPQGAGTGDRVASDMAEVLELVHRYGHVADLATIQGFDLFSSGIAFDRVSDILCNILKNRFIKYTQKTANKLQIPLEPVTVKHASWDKANARWNDAVVDLPKSPVTGKGVLLTPERFLKDMPEVTKDGFYKWTENNEGATLSQDFGYLMATALSQPDRRAVARTFARRYPDKAAKYLQSVAREVHLPYNVEEDPRGLVRFREIGTEAGQSLGLQPSDQPQTQADMNEFVDTLATRFKHAVEQADLWKALWAGDEPQQEKIIQAIAGAIWTESCRAADVDLGQEVNRGRGPVDFKFSKGWDLRTLLEVKRINSSGFFKGASVQLPQYLRTEQIGYGIYLCVGHFESDFAEKRLERVQETIDAVGKAKGVRMKLVLIDARKNKKSASKQKDGAL